MSLSHTPNSNPKLLWSPLLAAAIEFENGAILRALVGVQDHQDGAAAWRVSRHVEDATVVVGQGSASSLDLAVNAAGSFVFNWGGDGAMRGGARLSELPLAL